MKPGKLAEVQPVSEEPRAGNVYLLRGFIGIFSTGIDALGVKLADQGVRAQVFQDDQWRKLAATIAERHKGNENVEPLVLIGHSYGADDVVRIARDLDEHNVTVDLLVTLDPVTPPAIPKNVALAYNLYQPSALDGLPWLRGVAVKPAVQGAGEIQNLNIRNERRDLLEPGTDHFNIEKKGKIHDAVIEQVLITCPTREDWLAMRRGPHAEPQTPISTKHQLVPAAPNASAAVAQQPVVVGRELSQPVPRPASQ